ncbi:hypothetical protein SH139x_002618 [Planctomycetaceae bacterium SH139]
MKRTFALCLLVTSSVAAQVGYCTDRYYRDIAATSPAGRYQVTATSPENKNQTEDVAFQSNFTYAFKDMRTEQIIWIRKQPMGAPKVWGGDPKHTYTPALGGSPADIHVSDTGFTVIYTGLDELIVIDPKGQETGKINVLDDCLTKEEENKYVSHTTAGPLWASRSHWYFANVDSREYFIIRPWWGRHFIIELMTGGNTRRTKRLAEAIEQAEKEYVLKVLQPVLDGTAAKCDCCDCAGGTYEVEFVAYLAGVLRIKEAVPALRKIENSTHIGISTSGGFSKVPEGRVTPFNFATYTTRQNVHLSLRRLGEKPGAFPCTEFNTHHEEYAKQKLYLRKPVPGTRESNAEKVKQGMSPEEVINPYRFPRPHS